MDLITEYILALTNLYGQVSPKVVAEIYNRQNEDRIDRLEVEAYLQADLSRHYVYAYRKHFVHETTMEFYDFDRIENERRGKPYYVPEKEELLRYSDMHYFEKPEQYQNLLDYVMTNIMPQDRDKAEDLCEDFLISCKVEFKSQDAVYFLNDIGADLIKRSQLKETMDLIIELVNNVRLWGNYGHTSQEIIDMAAQAEVEENRSRPPVFGMISSHQMDTKKKTGRNDPCPCGSGRKYKVCCLAKDNES